MNDDDSASPANSETAIDALIEEFGGDPRLAILALLHDIDALARDFDSSVSRGFVRRDKAVWLQTISALKVAGGS